MDNQYARFLTKEAVPDSVHFFLRSHGCQKETLVLASELTVGESYPVFVNSDLPIKIWYIISSSTRLSYRAYPFLVFL